MSKRQPPKTRTSSQILLEACEHEYSRHFLRHELMQVAELVRDGLVMLDDDHDEGRDLQPTDKGMLVYYRHKVSSLEAKLAQPEPYPPEEDPK